MQGSKRWAPGWVIASVGNAEEREPEGGGTEIKLADIQYPMPRAFFKTIHTQTRALDIKLFMTQEERRVTTEKELEALSSDIF